MTPSDRLRPATTASREPIVSLAPERRVDPGTPQRTNVNPTSPLSAPIPRGRDNTGAQPRMGVKR
jgi:hypothetical protein